MERTVTKKTDVFSDFWMALDNTAKIYPSITSARMSNIFRISATLKEPVNVELLGTAVRHSMDRYPYFRVVLRKGFFWYYLEHTEAMPVIQSDTRYPCQKIPIKRKGEFLFLTNRTFIFLVLQLIF